MLKSFKHPSWDSCCFFKKAPTSMRARLWSKMPTKKIFRPTWRLLGLSRSLFLKPLFLPSPSCSHNSWQALASSVWFLKQKDPAKDQLRRFPPPKMLVILKDSPVLLTTTTPAFCKRASCASWLNNPPPPKQKGAAAGQSKPVPQ